MTTSDFRPHDLLTLNSARDLMASVSLPEWVYRAIDQAPLVVVRRDQPSVWGIPVGVRGFTRGQRFAAYLPESSIIRQITPEQLAMQRQWRNNNVRHGAIPALAILDKVEAVVAEFGYRWGPTGSVGFELASGYPTANANSDLDLILRAPEAMPADDARRLFSALAPLPVRIDVQIEVPAGAISLAEYAAQTADKILMRSASGPLLVTYPWAFKVQ